MLLKTSSILLLSVLLFGCATPKTQEIAQQAGFKDRFIQTTLFKLASYQKIKQPGRAINIYIEGDGNAWKSLYRLSNDPSPRNGTVMQLAALDPNPNVVYLARPCQYSPDDLASICESKYWSTARYSEVVINSMNEAVSQIKHQSGARKINLIGFSGGASIAILLAAERNDIASIRTIAGNLDLVAMQEHHQTTALSESLDPIKVARKVRNIPQLHFVGAKDKVVPEFVVRNFTKAGGLNPDCVIVLPKAEHHKGWVQAWPELYSKPFEFRLSAARIEQ